MKSTLRLPRTAILFLIGLFALGTLGFASYSLLDGMQYRAVKVGSDRDIDDSFNKMAKDGWDPRFVLQFEGDNRLIYERPRDEEERRYDLKYRAEVVRSGKEIDDKLNEMSEDGWFPRFVFRTGALNQNWRIMLEKDPEFMSTELEYQAVMIEEGRNVDDKFNQMSADGWYPLFVVEGLSELRMLFARDPEDTERRFRFMAKTTRNIKQIDDLYNEWGEEGWEPMFLFKDDTEAYRTLFLQPIDEEPIPQEFQAVRIDEISQVEDKFAQHSADGWYPMFVIRDIEELYEDYTDSEGKERSRSVDNVRWRMLFARDLE
jgi:hypothetical protein